MIARKNLLKNKEKSKVSYDKKQHDIVINVGDKVLLKEHNQKGKLGAKWNGPYTVISLHDNENVSIQRGRKEVKIHKNEVKIFNS